jgi:Zn finger protein HypA/HybF involved in hydrogenase expression
MHEFTLAKTILDSVLKKAKDYNLKRITGIKLKIGFLKMVTPVSLQNAFNIVSMGTKAYRAKLDIEEVAGDELLIINIEGEKD